MAFNQGKENNKNAANLKNENLAIFMQSSSENKKIPMTIHSEHF